MSRLGKRLISPIALPKGLSLPAPLRYTTTAAALAVLSSLGTGIGALTTQAIPALIYTDFSLDV